MSEALRKSYAQSADVACEQVAAIRTVAALNRENQVLRDFMESLEQPVHDALMKTLRSTFVRLLIVTMINGTVVWIQSMLHVLLIGSYLLVWKYAIE